MGTIVLARDESLGRTVVLKILLEKHQKNHELSDRFRREAAITAQLQHPGIPPVYGAGKLSDTRPFFSMRLVQGQTLAQLLSESVDHLKDRPRFLTIFEQVCQTVAFAHARGVIHRDLKPANIVVGDYGSVYVMDWGIARFLRTAKEQCAGRRSAAAVLVGLTSHTSPSAARSEIPRSSREDRPSPSRATFWARLNTCPPSKPAGMAIRTSAPTYSASE